MQQPRIDVTAILHFSRARLASSRSRGCGHAAPVCQVCANVGDALPCTTRVALAARIPWPVVPRGLGVFRDESPLSAENLTARFHATFPLERVDRITRLSRRDATRRDACACTRCLRYINRRVTLCYFVVSPPSVALSRSTWMSSSCGCSIVRIEHRLSVVLYRRVERQTIRSCSGRKIFGNGIGSSRRLEAA